MIALIGFGAVIGARQVWFLGTDDGGRIALFRGLPYELPFGIELYSQQESVPITLQALPEDRRSVVTDHELRSEDDAVSLVEDLQNAAEAASAQDAAADDAAGGSAAGGSGGQNGGGAGGQAAGSGELSARNRELFGLVPVAGLLICGFASVFVVRGDEVENLSLIFGAYFFAICLAAHVFLRIRLPNADPYLFPLVALLAAIGLVMLYRIDESLARDQANWFVVGLVLFMATIVLLKDYHVLERYRYLIVMAGLFLLLLPRVPGIGAQVNGAYLGIDVGPLAFQPAELGKIAVIIFLASYLREKREVLVVGARRIAGVTLPPLKHLGPMLVVWGAAMVLLVFIRDLGSSLMFFGAFLALIYVATNRFSFVVIGMADVPRRRLVLRLDGRARRRPRRHLARPLPGRRSGTRLPAPAVDVRAG